MILGGIEAGGTKMVCGIADENGKLIERVSIPTTTADETIGKMIDYFKDKHIDALGIACFGPLDLNEKSPTYGNITRTPKAGWEDTNIVKPFKDALGVPVGLDTDVNGAILGEVVFGAAKDCSSAIYITIGTGIGVGVYVNGGLLHGLVHPESGHISLERHPEDRDFVCNCGYHKSCFEGLAAGPSLQKRWGKPAVELYNDAKVWEMESYYIGQAIADYVLTYSPEKVVLWGGVMHNEALFDMVRKQVKANLNGYIVSEMVEDKINEYIVAPGLGDDPGIIGATQLGLRALNK